MPDPDRVRAFIPLFNADGTEDQSIPVMIPTKHAEPDEEYEREMQEGYDAEEEEYLRDLYGDN